MPLAQLSRKESARRFGSSVKTFASSRIAVAVATVILGSLIVASALLPQAVTLEEGQFAKRDIQAQRTIVNRVATEKLREEARKTYLKNAPSFPDNYEINQSCSYMSEEAVESVFSAVDSARSEMPDEEDLAAVGRRAAAIIDDGEGISVSAEDLALLASMDEAEREDARDIAVALVGSVMRENRITDSNLQEIAAGIPEALLEKGVAPEYVAPISRIVVSAIRPNLSLSLAKVEKAAEEEADLVQPVYVQKGQNIIRRGEPATQETIEILRDLGLLGARGSILGWVGVISTTALAVGYVAVYLQKFPAHAPNEQGMLSLVAIAGLLVLLLASILANLTPDYAAYLVPAAFATMIISFLASLEMALVVNLSVAALVGVLLRGNMFAMLASLAAGAAGAYSAHDLHERANMTRAVVAVGTAVAAVSVCYGLAFGEPEIVSRWYLGFVNGIISTVMTLGSLPFFETLFGVSSSLRLLELSNPGHPLLRRLLLEAPGTYHHSILVGNLAETAAQAIEADALLVRVGALYHDCGKLKRPYFFVENQFAQANPHDKISPALSTLVITSHVKDGVELARQYKLPAPVISIIQQHHGTGLVLFFYARAAESERDLCIDEKDFRYPGPKPQTREAAVVMLADSVEAAVRSMSNPSSWQVQNTVRKIIKDKLSDGQLDECDLTLRELSEIERAFISVLSGVYHERVEYPELPPHEPGTDREREEVKAAAQDGVGESLPEHGDNRVER